MLPAQAARPCITTTLSYFSLNKRESQRECLWKPTSSCSTPWLSIDSAMCRRKESRLSPSSCRTFQCDQNSDSRQCNRTWIEWGSDPAKPLSIWRPQPKQNGAEICIWSIDFVWERKEVRRRRVRKRKRMAIAGRQPEKSLFETLSDLNQAAPNHLADENQTR